MEIAQEVEQSMRDEYEAALPHAKEALAQINQRGLWTAKLYGELLYAALHQLREMKTVSFLAFANAMVKDFGEAVIPSLVGLYLAAHHFAGYEPSRMADDLTQIATWTTEDVIIYLHENLS